MTSDELHAELENDRSWREGELRFLQNRCKDLSEEDKEKYLRALVLMAYAHVEGFTKFALLGYVRCINANGLNCADVEASIAAASLREVFFALQNPEKKSTLFSDAPDDSALHRLAREREFVLRSFDILAKPVNLPDSVVNTESNLWPIVLRKNLFRLGLPHERFAHLESNLSMLVNTRNEIGHGATPKPIKWTLYEKLRDTSIKVMRDLQSTLFTASNLQWYRKRN
ncbi:hypothetical protein J2W49_003491 [Hydrogenophaga palleronii]|uniref:MAE-28990/MAE-18760-like HEPN domain-containing protein n=1 Tax=Hydrogenophaga palleronii TaxID=65655 RepID=A0ABU1WQE7_9BURK|nr:MAE_28990/MAE_18760 family HEPN-like nuclease [Hydrogenophaga palleronii]MDR7151515.1 hypothetical protein [Hydrogenophaga palleronii]